MATDPLAEDRDQVMLDLRKAGYGDDVLARAREVTDATASIVASRGLRGWEQLAAVRAKYSGEPWWPAIQGEFTGMVRSEEHTSELQSLMRISYAVFCLKKKKNQQERLTMKGSR